MSQGPKLIKDSEYEYDDKEEGLYAEKVALNTNTQINLRAMPLKTYLDQSVMPSLTKALSELCKKKPRPADPAEWLAYYLLANHPKKNEKSA